MTVLLAGMVAVATLATAQTVQWIGPGNGWNTNANWNTGVVPASGETALFTGPTPTTINVAGGSVDIDGIQFNLGSPAYTFNVGSTFVMTGAGIANNAATRPTFNVSFALMELQSGTAGNAIINNDGALTFDGNATGGTATINASSGTTTSFTDTANAGNATIVNTDGLLQFSSGADARNAQISATGSNGKVEFHDGTNAGTATITASGSGTITFQDTSTAQNATVVADTNGLVRFRDSANAGSATITANASGLVQFQNTASAQNATIVVNNNGNVAFGGQSTGGNARFIVNSGGTLDLVGLDSAFSGFTAGSIEGAGTFCICDHLMTVGSNNRSTEVTGRITGTNGALTKVGTGTLILSGTADYTGATTVNGGTLRVNTNLTSSSSITVNAGGTLGGNGTLPSLTVNGGTLAPGNSIGTLTVQGNLSLSSATAYLVELDPSNADRTLVTGTVSLAGTVQAAFASGTYLQRNYTILTANGGRTGAFGTLNTSNLPAGFRANLTYDPNNAYLTLTAVLGEPTPTPTPTPSPAPTPTPANPALPFVLLNENQQNVATSLNSFFNNGGALSPRFVEVFRLTGDNLRSALSQLSGEIATQISQAAFSSVDYFLNLMLDPFVTGRSGDMADGQGANNFAADDAEADAYAAKRRRSAAEQDAYAAMAHKAPPRDALFVQRWSMWGAAYGGMLKMDGNTAVGARDASTRAYGFAAGADYRSSPDTLTGFALSGGGTSFSLAQGAGNGRSDVFQAGAFIRHTIGQAYLKAAMAYGWHDVTTERLVGIAGIDRLDGRYNASSFAARGEAGYRFATPWVGVTPYAAGQSITYFMPGYSDQVELGLNTFALNYASRDLTSARSELGLRADRSFVLSTALVTLRGRAAWAHYFDDRRSLTASFQTLAAPAFVVTGSAQAREAALVSAAAETKWANGLSLAASFEGEFSGRTQGYAGKGIVRYSW